jgi:excisionase family DNA binding protein
MDKPEGLISLREAARRLGVGGYTIRRLVKGGELRCFRVRTVLRIDPLDLRRYLRAHPAAQIDRADDDGNESPQRGRSID